MCLSMNLSLLPIDHTFTEISLLCLHSKYLAQEMVKYLITRDGCLT